MDTNRWRNGIVIWGLVVLVYCIVVWPWHSSPSPFSKDEALLAARVGVMVRFSALWLLPVAAVWALFGRDRRSSPN